MVLSALLRWHRSRFWKKRRLGCSKVRGMSTLCCMIVNRRQKLCCSSVPSVVDRLCFGTSCCYCAAYAYSVGRSSPGLIDRTSDLAEPCSSGAEAFLAPSAGTRLVMDVQYGNPDPQCFEPRPHFVCHSLSVLTGFKSFVNLSTLIIRHSLLRDFSWTKGQLTQQS